MGQGLRRQLPDGTVTVIDGASNTTTTVTWGANLCGAVNPVTNQRLRRQHRQWYGDGERQWHGDGD
jgi:hypothetical protein